MMTKILSWNFEKIFLKCEKMASRKIFRLFLRANFFMFILLSNHTVFLVQFGVNLHLWVFQKAEITLAEAARAISAFWKIHSCKLIPNWTRNRMITYTNYLVIQLALLYLATQIRFPIGGERATCRGSPKLTNSLGRTKLTNSLGKQQLELSTRTWSGRAPWNGGKFGCQSAWCQKAIEVGQRFSLERTLIIQEKGFITRQKHIRLTKGKIWTFCVFKLLIWRQKMGRLRSATRTSIAVNTRQVRK